ncbi:MAG TPA: uracil-DNA glycosylase [Methylophilaceae bacterium]|nr:uracil-DNA glycosylase [Methylophilaceae bacterium]
MTPSAAETGLADAVLASPSAKYSNEQPVRESHDKKTPDATATLAVDEPQLPVEEIPPDEPAAAEKPAKDMPSPALSPMGDDRVETIQHMAWPALQQAVEHCPACNLCKTRTKTVFGVGDQDADWLFVGEAPGAEEDRKGEPFVGQAGKLLDNMLAAIGLKRGDNVYIANVLKCRPPDNRDPHGEEVMQCDPYLKRQVDLIQPKLIVALGKFAAQSLLNSKSSIGAMRGTLHDYNGVPVIVTYHPAYLLRSPAEKAKAWEDLCYARDTMQSLQAGLQSAGAAPSKHKP